MKAEERRLSDHLLATRTQQQLADDLAKIAFQRVRLLDQVGALEVELFWMKVAERDRQLSSDRRPESGEAKD